MSLSEMEIERLISRCLDGEATDDERLDLDREILRNPDAHRMLESSRRIDDVAGTVLREVLQSTGEPTLVDPPTVMVPQPVQSRRIATQWLLVPGAIAAAVLALIIPPPVGPTRDQQVSRVPEMIQTAPMSLHDQPVDRGLMRNVGATSSPMSSPMRSQIHRRRGREILGIERDDGSLFWIEIDRTRKFERRIPRINELETTQDL